MPREGKDIKKLKAGRRAEFRLKQTFERIDWEEDELAVEVAALTKQLAITAGKASDYIEVNVLKEESD